MQNHTFLPIKSELIDGFWCSRCLNDRIDLPELIGSLASGANTSLVAKNETKKTFDLFFTSIHASRKLLYSLCFSKYMKIINSTLFYGPRTTTFEHRVFISTTFITQSFVFKMTYFHCQYLRRKSLLFRCELLNKT